jgi:peptidoglycan/LPS O-acetylase OafA/YrhL
MVFFNTNYLFATQANYFDIGSSVKPLLHTWSLSIEEQFYLIYPAILLITFRFQVKKLYAALALISATILSIILTDYNPTISFYMMPSRIAEFIIGAMATNYDNGLVISKRWKIFTSIVTAFLLLYPIFEYSNATKFPGAAALMPCLGAFIVICTRDRTNHVNTVLSLKPVVYIGLISYPLYLWHWPLHVFYLLLHDVLFEFMRLRHEFLFTVGLLTLTVALSILTFYYIETPIRRKKVFGSDRQLYTFFATSTVALFTICFSWSFLGKAMPPPWRVAGLAPNVPIHVLEGEKYHGFECESCIFIGEKTDKPEYILWGDSQSIQIRPLFWDLYKNNRLSGLCITSRVPAIGVLRKTYEMHNFAENSALINFIINYIRLNKIKIVVISSLWNYFLDGDCKGTMRKMGLTTQLSQSPTIYGQDADIDYTELFQRQLNKTIDMIKRAGASVWIVKSIPEQNIVPPLFCDSLSALGLKPDNYFLPLSELAERRAKIEKVFENLKGKVNFIDPADALCTEKGCRISFDNKPLYADEIHLNAQGTKFVKKTFDGLFKAFNEIKPFFNWEDIAYGIPTDKSLHSDSLNLRISGINGLYTNSSFGAFSFSRNENVSAGTVTFTIEYDKAIMEAKIQIFAKIANHGEGSYINCEWSNDGINFQPLSNYTGSPNDTKTALFDRPLFIFFSPNSNKIFMRFSLYGSAQLWFNEQNPILFSVAD